MKTGISRKQLCKETGAPYYVIDYLGLINKLPLLKESNGRGNPTVYHRDSIEIVIKHINR